MSPLVAVLPHNLLINPRHFGGGAHSLFTFIFLLSLSRHTYRSTTNRRDVPPQSIPDRRSCPMVPRSGPLRLRELRHVRRARICDPANRWHPPACYGAPGIDKRGARMCKGNARVLEASGWNDRPWASRRHYPDGGILRHLRDRGWHGTTHHMPYHRAHANTTFSPFSPLVTLS